jgi:hypothetical protein
MMPVSFTAKPRDPFLAHTSFSNPEQGNIPVMESQTVGAGVVIASSGGLCSGWMKAPP